MYVAEIAYGAPDETRLEVVHWADPPANATTEHNGAGVDDPEGVEENVTVPVGVPPALVSLTVAVNVTVSPCCDGFSDEVTLTPEGCGPKTPLPPGSHATDDVTNPRTSTEPIAERWVVASGATMKPSNASVEPLPLIVMLVALGAKRAMPV